MIVLMYMNKIIKTKFLDKIVEVKK